MAARIRTVRRQAAAALGGLAALALAACGSRVALDQQPTASPSTTSPSPSPTTPAPTTEPPTETPSPASSTPASRTPTPSRTPVPSPTPTHDPTPTDTPRVVVGRPLRARRRLLTPDVGRGTAPLHPDHRRLATLPAPLRADLAALWLHAARMEHASVPAFAEVALLLGAAGAPLDLVAAAHRAALDEVRHTDVSYALANAYGGTAYAPGALPRLLGRRVGSRLRGRTAALRRLAVESLRDGCLGEGYAGGLAAAGAATAADPAVRDALAGIARDEAAHAELAWQVLGWSLATGGRPVAAAVAKALATLPERAATPTGRDDLEPYGWPAPATAAAVHRAVRSAVADRAAGLLALSRPVQQVPVQ